MTQKSAKVIVFWRGAISLVAMIDAWIKRQPDKPSRPQAITRLLLIALKREGIKSK